METGLLLVERQTRQKNYHLVYFAIQRSIATDCTN